MLAERLPQKPSRTIPNHRISDPTRGYHSQTAFLVLLTPAPVQYQATVDHTVTFLLDSRKVAAAFNSAGSRQADEWIGHRITLG